MRRVVVTGLGMVSPLGAGVEPSWNNLVAGRSGLRRIERFDVSDLPAKVAGLVPAEGEPNGLRPADFIDAKELRRNDHFIILGMVAAGEAIADSGFPLDTEEQQNRAGVLIGSGIGGLNAIAESALILEKHGPRRISPFFIPSALINLASGQVSIKFKLRGPNHSVVTACSTGAHAIGDAARFIKSGDADVMVAGGTEAAVSRLGMAGFAAARALSTAYNDTPSKASRPWDKGRDGFVMAEGAGVVVLEEYEHAKARGAKIYAEIKGYGLSGDAYHVTSPLPDGDGGFRSMSAALRNANLTPIDIDYVNAHGTSTPMGDEIELGAVKRLFGNAIGSMSMSSTKSAIGHLLGAAGSVEAIFCILAIQNQIVPPTLNLEDPEEAADGVDLVPLVAKERQVRNALSNSFGFGGTNASLIIGVPD